jgi:hypothetical protein
VIVGSNTNSQLYQQTKIRGTGNKQTTSASFVVIDNTNMPPLSLTLAQGDVVRLTLMGMVLTATGVICFDFQVVQPTLGTVRSNPTAVRGITSVTQAVNQPLNAVTSFVAAESGVHTFQPVWVQIGGGTGTLYNDSVTNDTEIFVSAEKIGVQGASSGGNVPSFSSANLFLAGPSAGQGPVGLRPISSLDLPITPYVKIMDRQTAGTDGGTFTTGAWRTRTLNVIDSDLAGIASLASNQITLPAGTYRCSISPPAYSVNSHVARLQNITSSTTLLSSQTARAPATGGLMTSALITGKIILPVASVLEVQHSCETTGTTSGFGLNAGTRTNPAPAFDIYTVAEFWKDS